MIEFGFIVLVIAFTIVVSKYYEQKEKIIILNLENSNLRGQIELMKEKMNSV